MIKTFRGLLADDTEAKIRLSTKKGKIGYRIVKFQIMSTTPLTVSTEAIMKVYKITQTNITTIVDFTDGNLLAAALWTSNASADVNPFNEAVIFDREIFNQDIFITFMTGVGSARCNYYLELETINMTDNAAAVSTLRDIRLNPQVGA